MVNAASSNTETDVIIEDALSVLSAEDRFLVYGRLYAGLSHSELGQILGGEASIKNAEIVFNADEDAFDKTLSIYLKKNDMADELSAVKKAFGFKDSSGKKTSPIFSPATD